MMEIGAQVKSSYVQQQQQLEDEAQSNSLVTDGDDFRGTTEGSVSSQSDSRMPKKQMTVIEN